MKSKPVVKEQSLGSSEDNNILIGPQLAKVTNRLRRYLDNRMKIFELSRTQWQVLFTIHCMGACLQKDLLNNLDIDAAHLARVLEKLEDRKYIVREKLNQDRRAIFIKMTPLAIKQLVPNIVQIHADEHDLLLKGLNTSEIKQLGLLLKKLENNMNVALENTTKDETNE
jgi:MarR family multiple antibiotic resistance transcriptional regulator